MFTGRLNVTHMPSLYLAVLKTYPTTACLFQPSKLHLLVDSTHQFLKLFGMTYVMIK